ncbi:MAG: glucosaminidase domain-containing protein, partial [Chloroflexota bacterium]
MRTHLSRRVALGALALLTTLAVVAPVEARSPVRKIEPRRVVPYRVGGAFTVNTNVLSVSGYAAGMIDEALGPTTPLPPLGAAFLRAERTQGINARYFVAHAMLESGWGGSDIARLKRNLFGYNAYDRDPWRHASRFPSHAKGIAVVAAAVKRSYLTPGGRWWYRFPTLRAVNRYYASDPHWAEKVAHLANVIDGLVVTLRERGLRFRSPAVVAQPVVGAPLALDVPWRARPGAVLPSAIRFVVRWTPLALVEASPDVPAAVPAPRWAPARRADRPNSVARLALRAPSLPGLWRLDVEARDSDGRPLPKTDRPAIASITVRVAAPGEAALAVVAGDDGRLAVTVRPIAPAAVAGESGATADETPATLQVWALPLDPARDAYLLGSLPLPPAISASAPWTVSVRAPAEPAVVVARLAGASGVAGRTAPIAALAGRDADGRLEVTQLPVASPRDDVLLRRRVTAVRVGLGQVDVPGSLEVAVGAGDLPPAVGAAVADAEDAPGPHALLVRSLAADAGREAGPTDAFVVLPGESPGAARLTLSGLPAGVRLVVAGLVPPDGGPVDPATLTVAWIAVTALAGTGTAP